MVVNYATNKAGGEAIVAACKASGADAILVQGDVSNDADCLRLVQAAIDKWGRLDVLINNAATTKPVPHKRMDLLNKDDFERIFAVNVIGTYQMTRAAAPHLKKTGDAAIVNISSVGAMRAGGSSIAYTASKAAINNSRSRPRALSRPRCGQCALPGGTLGRWTRNILSEEGYQERLKAASTQYPLKRGIWPYDVAVAALFLVEGATTMTGESIRMDCGQHLGDTSARN